MITCAFEDGGKALLRHVVVDTLILKDNKILMVKRTDKLLEGGKWAVVGGFMERDETTAETARREAYEETGWDIDGLTLLTIIDSPNRLNEDRQNVVFVYFSRAVKQTGQPDWESDDMKWYDLDNLPPRDQIAFDHAGIIDLYKKYLVEKPALPILSGFGE